MACGLFGLALLPASPSDLDIIWRMALCGAGFGLFQSPMAPSNPAWHFSIK
jgi:DHA2 family multidrug resistance protein-like MFS transporter